MSYVLIEKSIFRSLIGRTLNQSVSRKQTIG